MHIKRLFLKRFIHVHVLGWRLLSPGIFCEFASWNSSFLPFIYVPHCTFSLWLQKRSQSTSQWVFSLQPQKYRACLTGFSPCSHRKKSYNTPSILLTQNQTYHSLTCSLPVITPAYLLEGCHVTPPLTFILPSLILFGQCFCL